MTISEIREQLLTRDEEFQRLVDEHTRYANQLQQLSRDPFHSAEDLLLESELKKLKLRLKDEMERRIAEYKQAS